jgi:drug/metabolite transporter superfamily protein YnfA
MERTTALHLLVVSFQVLAIYCTARCAIVSQKGMKGKRNTYCIASISANVLFCLIMFLNPQALYYLFLGMGFEYILLSLVWTLVCKDNEHLIVDISGLIQFLVGMAYIVTAVIYRLN